MSHVSPHHQPDAPGVSHLRRRRPGRRAFLSAVLEDSVARPASALRDQALADAGVQAMLDVFPAEIRDVEEM